MSEIWKEYISFAVESKKRKQWWNAAASLATGSICRRSIFKEYMKRVPGWAKTPIHGPTCKKLWLISFLKKKKWAHSKLNHIHFQNGGSQNGSPDIRYCIFFLSMMMIRNLCNCGILLWQRLKKIWYNDSWGPYMAQVLHLLDVRQWANHQTRKKWQMAFVVIFFRAAAILLIRQDKTVRCRINQRWKKCRLCLFVTIQIFWGKKISLFARKE